MKTLTIVGNGKVKNDLSKLVDSSDVVIRFNNLDNYDVGTGKKIDFWVLSSNKFLINKLIQEPQPIKGNTNLNVKELILLTEHLLFSIPPFFPIKIDYQQNIEKNERKAAVLEFLNFFQASNHSHEITEYPNQYLYDLTPLQWPINCTCPSNGYLITRKIINDIRYKKYEIKLIGFSWEGWEGHPWLFERLYLENLEKNNIVSILF